MNTTQLELYYFVITSARSSDICDILWLEIYKEGT